MAQHTDSAAAASSKSVGSKQHPLRKSTLGTSLGLTTQTGELVAVAFPHKSGFRDNDKPAFSSETTTRFFVKKVRAAADSTCEHKVLMPYHPHAPRNRPRSTMTNIVGRRYGVHPASSTERGYKGQSQVGLRDGDPESKKPWKTTKQVFEAGARVTGVVGLANAGISSDIACRMHKLQGVYH